VAAAAVSRIERDELLVRQVVFSVIGRPTADFEIGRPEYIAGMVAAIRMLRFELGKQFPPKGRGRYSKKPVAGATDRAIRMMDGLRCAFTTSGR
jgi:hypothetical protein